MSGSTGAAENPGGFEIKITQNYIITFHFLTK
jgi:hypothetical protein